MTPPSSLAGTHRQTYEAIFRHPIAHNLSWHDVRALFGQLGHVIEEPNGSLKLTRNGQILVLRAPRTKEVGDAAELIELRHFLERSEKPLPAATASGAQVLVVIDHHEARIFRSQAHGSAAEQILPHDPADFFRHAHNSKDFARGREKPDPNSFFGPVATALKDTGRILVCGGGTGTGSEKAQFLAWLKDRHPELAARIAGSLVIDEHHLTDAQLLAKAREFFARPVAPAAAASG
jgi:hypothetical protein